MKKGILKNRLFLVLATFSAGMLIWGFSSGLINNEKADSLIQEKAKIISNFKETPKYFEITQEKKEVYYQALNLGVITQEEYEEKMDFLLSDEFAEKCIFAENNLENIDKINNLNKKIHKHETLSVAGTICSIAGFLVTPFVGLSLISKDNQEEHFVQ